uniref:G_PROTEIN_RECEP_F1_2 domain-containing protein n=1 Tax=Steinernema glaseri TaxID=37863 RepID=A0A1I8AI64_9BILA
MCEKSANNNLSCTAHLTLSLQLLLGVLTTAMLYSQLIGTIQFSLRIPMYFMAFLFLFLSFQNVSPKAMYKISPIIAIQLLVNALTIFICAPLDMMISPFLLLRWFEMTNPILKAIVMITVMVKTLAIFRDFLSIGFFVHRTYYLLRPLRSRTKNYAISMIVFTVTIALSASFIIPYLESLEGISIKADCFYASCISGTSAVGRKMVVFIMVTMSILTVISGCVFVIVLRKKVTPATDKKINRVLKYEFLFRCMFETFPFMADTISSFSFNFSIGYYLGAYSTQFITMDVLIFTIVYYRILRRHKQLTINVNCELFSLFVGLQFVATICQGAYDTFAISVQNGSRTLNHFFLVFCKE